MNIGAQKSKNHITLEVEGRQGVAASDNYYFVSGSKSLYKYSKEGKLLKSNLKPFKNLTFKANHLGDFDFYNNELYTGVEYFFDGKASNIQIAVYDAETLNLTNSFNIDTTSGQKEICAVTVDPKTKILWTADWTSGSYLYKYNVETGEYLGKLHIFPVPEKQQGIKVINQKMYITADDGDAEFNEADHLYSIDLFPKQTFGKVKLLKTFNTVKLNGEIEGLTYDKESKNLIVHFNRGTRVINGMPTGFYPGYTKEIHELYFFNFKPIEGFKE